MNRIFCAAREVTAVRFSGSAQRTLPGGLRLVQGGRMAARNHVTPFPFDPASIDFVP